jgi:hypothetical protein
MWCTHQLNCHVPQRFRQFIRSYGKFVDGIYDRYSLKIGRNGTTSDNSIAA